MSGRGRVLVLVPHEPTLDPRVHYTTESLARKDAVTVVATVPDSEARPAENQATCPSYESIRIRYRKQGEVSMWRAFLALWVRSWFGATWLGDVMTTPLTWVLLVTLGVLASVVLGLAVALELILLLPMLATAQRPPLLLLGLRAVRGLGWVAWSSLSARERSAPTTAPRIMGGQRLAGRKHDWLAPGHLEKLTAGLRVTLSVFRFTFSATNLLWRCAVDNSLAPDVVYCHDLYSLQAGVMLKHRCRAKLVYDSHEYYPYQYQFWYYPPLVRFYESILVRAVDVYITVSPQLAAELSRVYGRTKVHAIPNVEPCPIRRSAPQDGAMSHLAKGRLKLLYQGRFWEGRGLEEVIREWRKVDGTMSALFLRGPRNPWLEHLERLAAEMGVLGQSVYVLPAVLEKNLISSAQEADIGLIPYKGDWLSYRFACPNKLSQYIHAGLAILGNRIPYVEQVVSQGRCGLCYDVCENGSFADAVSKLATDKTLVKEFRKNTLAFSQREYNWERYEPTLLKLVSGA